MQIDRPVYCGQINSEIFKLLGLPIQESLHRWFLRATLLSTTRPLYASHAQIVECFYNCPAFIEELAELSRLSLFASLSKQTSLGDFIAGRRRMYEWDRSAYPMYFDADLVGFKSIATTSQGDPSTTAILRERFSSLYLDQPPNFENSIDLSQRRILQDAAPEIRKLVTSEDGALTGAFFSRPLLGEPAKQLMSHILPAQFTEIYLDAFEGFTATGFPQLSGFEDKRSFPFLDFDVKNSLLLKLGLGHLVTDLSLDGFRKFLTFRLHGNFHEFVRAKDVMLKALVSTSRKSVSKHELVADLRSLPIRQIQNTLDPVAAAQEILRGSEQLVSRCLSEGKLIMADALSWRGIYLLMTATDIEDRVLNEVLTERGFTNPEVKHATRFSYLTRFRSDVGRIFLVRTSAGSGGSSGAFVVGKNALEELKPRFVISVGICFGLLPDKQKLGDVVVSEQVHDYERQRVSKERPEDRGATREGGSTLLSRARATRVIWDRATVHCGTVASGEKLVDDEDFRNRLKQLQPPAIAGDMEAWGLSAVCHEAQTQFIMVKGICDWGFDKTKEAQADAARNASNFVLDALVVPQ